MVSSQHGTTKRFEGSVNWISSVLIPKQRKNFCVEVVTKEEKRFGWIKEHALWRPNGQIVATPAQSFPELKRAFPNP